MCTDAVGRPRSCGELVPMYTWAPSAWSFASFRIRVVVDPTNFQGPPHLNPRLMRRRQILAATCCFGSTGFFGCFALTAFPAPGGSPLAHLCLEFAWDSPGIRLGYSGGGFALMAVAR